MVALLGFTLSPWTLAVGAGAVGVAYLVVKHPQALGSLLSALGKAADSLGAGPDDSDKKDREEQDKEHSKGYSIFIHYNSAKIRCISGELLEDIIKKIRKVKGEKEDITEILEAEAKEISKLKKESESQSNQVKEVKEIENLFKKVIKLRNELHNFLVLNVMRLSYEAMRISQGDYLKEHYKADNWVQVLRLEYADDEAKNKALFPETETYVLSKDGPHGGLQRSLDVLLSSNYHPQLDKRFRDRYNFLLESSQDSKLLKLESNFSKYLDELILSEKENRDPKLTHDELIALKRELNKLNKKTSEFLDSVEDVCKELINSFKIYEKIAVQNFEKALMKHAKDELKELIVGEPKELDATTYEEHQYYSGIIKGKEAKHTIDAAFHIADNWPLLFFRLATLTRTIDHDKEILEKLAAVEEIEIEKIIENIAREGEAEAIKKGDPQKAEEIKQQAAEVEAKVKEDEAKLESSAGVPTTKHQNEQNQRETQSTSTGSNVQYTALQNLILNGDFIELVSPTSTKFAPCKEPDTTITKKSSTTWQIESYYDSSNALGGIGRVRYLAVIQYDETTQKWSLSSFNEKKYNPNNTYSSTFDEKGAWEVTQKFILDDMVSPSTTKFAPCKEPDTTITKKTNNVWEIKSYADSQNPRGATVRGKFIINVEYNSSTKKWSLIEYKSKKGGKWKLVYSKPKA
ncbi:hypothetical protein ACFLQI_03525 [Candidatus Undinarchaeota archaeon]